MVRALLLLLGLAGCMALACPRPSVAAPALEKLVCPAAWPEDPNAGVVEADFTVHALSFGPSDFYSDPTPWEPFPGDEMSCVYSNGRQLLITIPGKPDTCYIGERKHPKPGEPVRIVYCTFAPTGDQAKDAVNIREMEPLTRATSIHGVRLGMTGNELKEVLHPRTDPVVEGYDGVFLLPDMGQILVGFGHGGISMAEFRPPPGRIEGLFDELRERFGFPERTNELDGPKLWTGEDGVRLVLYGERNFGNTAFPDEYAFLLDSKILAGLDDQLRRERGQIPRTP